MSDAHDHRILSYRADIDGMRAIAVLLVLAFHFEVLPDGNAGFIGVDVFFVISGFLITAILRTQLDRGALSLSGFYLNRIRRLAPALLVVLLGTLALGSVLLFPEEFTELAKQTVFAQLYVANIYYWRSVDYFGLTSDSTYLLHTWSLAVEEQFYLFYPLALLCVHRYLRKYFWIAVAVGAALSFLLNIAFVARKPEATFYLFPTRAWELLIGGLVLPVAASWSRARWIDEAVGALGLVLVFVATFGYSPEFHFPGFFALLPVAASVCLLLSGTRGTSVSRLLGSEPLAYVGRISYSLYLVHWPLNIFARRWWADDFTLPLRISVFVTSIAMASFLYHFVENPFRSRRLLGANRRLAWAYGTGVVATLSVFVLVQATGGLPQRFPAEVVRIAGYAHDRSPPLPECNFSVSSVPGEDGYCRIGQPGRPPTWLVYGDSHAWALHGAFDDWLKSRNEAGLLRYLESCVPLTGLHVFDDRGECFAFNQSVAAFLKTHPDISNVVLVSTWRQAPEGRLSTSSDVLLPPEASLRLFDERFAETVSQLHDAGRNVYVWEPVPGGKRSVPAALATAAWTHRPADVEITRERYMSDVAFFFAALERNRRQIVASFSPAATLCQTGLCVVSIDGDPIYFDRAHPGRSTSRFWAGILQHAEERTQPIAHAGGAAK